MSTVILKGHPDAGIPRGTEYQVCSLPQNVKVAEGTCSGSLPLDLDPGKYIAVFTKSDPRNPQTILMRHYETFLVDVDEAQFTILKSLHPRHSKSFQTSDGPRWQCQIGGCDFSGMSEYATVAHEAKHQGYDLRKESDRNKYLVNADPLAKDEEFTVTPTKAKLHPVTKSPDDKSL